MGEKYVLRAFPSSRRAEWDTFVEGHAAGHFLQSWGWGELKAGANWQPLRLGLQARATGELVAAAQVLRRTTLYLPARLGHLAYIPRGPVLDWSATTSEGQSLTRLFLLKLRDYLWDLGALALQIEPHLPADAPVVPDTLATLGELGFHAVQPVQPPRTIVLDIRPAEETLLAQMKEKWRYNVRLAARKGVEVRPAQSTEDLAAWYSLLQTTGQRDGFGIHTLSYYRKAWDIFVSGDQARLFLAYADGNLLAGIFVTRSPHEAIYLYGASANAGRNLMPNYLLQWEAIRWARQAGTPAYDFWGIPATDEPDEAMAGVYRFKSGWGGRVVSFPGNYQYDYHPRALRFARKILAAR